MVFCHPTQQVGVTSSEYHLTMIVHQSISALTNIKTYINMADFSLLVCVGLALILDTLFHFFISLEENKCHKSQIYHVNSQEGSA